MRFSLIYDYIWIHLFSVYASLFSHNNYYSNLIFKEVFHCLLKTVSYRTLPLKNLEITISEIEKRDHYRNRKHSFTCPKRAGNRCRRSDCRAGTYRYAYPFPWPRIYLQRKYPHRFTGRRRRRIYFCHLYGKYVSGRRQYRNFNRYFRKSERRKNTRLSTPSVSHKLRGEEMTDMEALKTAGACGFTDDGIPLKTPRFYTRQWKNPNS